MNKTTVIVILLFLTSSLSGCIEELTHTHNDGTTHSHPGEKNHTHTVSIDNVMDESPRIAFSPTMINQYNSEGVWMTDSQGLSGGIPLEYCQKWWPNTIDIELREEKETITFWTGGNTDPYVSTKDVYECIIEDENNPQSAGYSKSIISSNGFESNSLSDIGIVIMTSLVWIVLIIVMYSNMRNNNLKTYEDEEFTEE